MKLIDRDSALKKIDKQCTGATFALYVRRSGGSVRTICGVEYITEADLKRLRKWWDSKRKHPATER